MISVETYVDRQMVATYHGDGVLVSTPHRAPRPTRSARGGPVVSPRCACSILSPLAPHNPDHGGLRGVIPDTSEITLRIRARQAGASVTLDNRRLRRRRRRRIHRAALGASFFSLCRTISRSTTRYAQNDVGNRHP